ncbi:MAG TPA: HD domain-containing phosphohydrolase [Blastocatellia bacterium]|nr:HD domain-containing phosphohydrolase [Blastocatellia bacterium]
MQAQQAILIFNEADRSLGARLLKIAIEIDRVEGYSEPHAIAIAWVAEKVGARLGLHGIDLTALKFAALAHDLGERAMKRNYLLRPGELAWEETLDLWRHPILGEQAAGELKLPRQTQLLIRWHHEWWNGGGYPDGLAGESIPLGARILRAVDSYFALISDRPHRRGFDRADAEQTIADLAGIEFDPQVAKLLLQVLAEEAGGEGLFAYPYQDTVPDGDETPPRAIENQHQPLDEVIYANPHVEIPAEPPGGGHNSAPGPASSIARHETLTEAPVEVRDEIPDNAVAERPLEMADAGFASTEPVDEVVSDTRIEASAADFASADTIEEVVVGTWAESPTAELELPEPAEEFMAHEQAEIIHDGLTPPDATDVIEIVDEADVESHMEAPAADFTSSDATGETLDIIQTETAGAEIQIIQEKKEETES